MKDLYSKGHSAAALAVIAVFAGALVRSMLLTSSLPASQSSNSLLCFYICCAVGIFLFAVSTLMLFHGRKKGSAPTPESGMFFPFLLGAAGVFCDFIYQCVSCYDYVSNTAYPMANRIASIAACALFALLSCVYFIIMSLCARSSSIDLGRLAPLCATPFLWSLCHVFIGLTEYESTYDDTESIIKYIMLIFGLMFFFLLAAQTGKKARSKRGLAFFGFAYSSACFVAAVPRAIAYFYGAELPQAGYFSLSFLLVGIFAFAAAIEISLKRKV